MSLDATKGSVTYKVSWTAMGTNVCPKCMALDGETWIVDDVETVIVHPLFGPVYDPMTGEFLTHYGCQCDINFEPIVDLENTQLWQDSQLMFQEANHVMPSNIEEAKEQVHSLGLEYDLTYKQLRQLESILFRTLHLMRKAGLSEDMDQAIQKTLRAIALLRMFQRSMWLMEVGSGPLGWALAGVGLLTVGASAGDLIYDVTRGT